MSSSYSGLAQPGIAPYGSPPAVTECSPEALCVDCSADKQYQLHCLMCIVDA